MGSRDFRSVSVGVMVLCVVGVGEAPGEAPDATLSALVEAHNQERAAWELPPLAANAQLDAAAQVQARDMAEHDKLSHEGSDGSNPSQRIERQGYHYQRVGENVAEGQKSVEKVMQSWMNSPHHRANILGDFTEMGAAVAMSGDGTPYWCVDFGTPLPALDPSRAAAGLVQALNRARAKQGRPPLTVDAQLEAAAQRQARDMAAHGGFRQKDDAGPNPLEQIAKEGNRFDRLGETAASGQASPDEVVKTWLDDPANREDILGTFTMVGVGYATTEKGIPFWCAIFGRPAR